MTHYTINDLKIMAESMAASNCFRFGKEQRPFSPAQVMTLLLISNASGRHPAMGLMDYDLIAGKPAKKTDSMLRDFLLNDGKVEWHILNDTQASATFSHPYGGTVKIDWDIERAKKAGLLSKDMWQKWKRQMLRARTISEGVRTVFPVATSGCYNTEEMQDMSENIISVEKPIESLDILSKKVAEEVSSSFDLEATYLTNLDFFTRAATENPDYIPLMQKLFEVRQEELKNIA